VSYDSILVATDGSDLTERAVVHALGLAETYGATVHALSVVDTKAVSLADEGFSADRRLLDALEGGCRRAVDAVERRAAERGLQAVTAVRTGAPAARIRAYADEQDVDLIAMGTRGRQGVARRLLGSVAWSVLAHTDRPVLTARTLRGTAATPANPGYGDVLVPTDGSAGAERAAEHAVDVADRYGATVHALSVIDTGPAVSPPFLAALEEASEAALAAVERRAEAAGVPVRTKVWRGAPAECIRGYADERGVDLIAMGTHSRHGLDRFLDRSVTRRVVPTVDQPVLTLHGGDRREPGTDERPAESADNESRGA
jgi:nucleotide-binding universal stress UspA family protein